MLHSYSMYITNDVLTNILNILSSTILKKMFALFEHRTQYFAFWWYIFIFVTQKWPVYLLLSLIVFYRRSRCFSCLTKNLINFFCLFVCGKIMNIDISDSRHLYKHVCFRLIEPSSKKTDRPKQQISRESCI